jgi:hypothetical protein
VKDAQIKLRMEECASSMGQSEYPNCAVARDAQIKLSKEACAEGTGQSANYAAMKDAQIYQK